MRVLKEFCYQTLTSVLAYALLGAVILVMSTSSMSRADPEIDELMNDLRLPEMVSILIDEGQDYGETLRQDMIPDMKKAVWATEIDRIYDREAILSVLRETLVKSLGPAQTDYLAQFFSSPDGGEITSLELSARRVMSHEDILSASAAEYKKLRTKNDPLVKQIEDMIRAGDLIELNVAGSLNANMMFYRGMMQGGALNWSDAEMMSEVWIQEGAAREEALEWVHGFSLIAYKPLSFDKMQDYVEMWSSDAGKILNKALFEAYNQIYADVSYELGQGVARYMASEAL